LRLVEDDRGLAIEVDAPDTQMIRDLVMAPIQRGDITQMSFGFSVVQDGQDWGEDGDGMMIRTLTKVRLFDVSPVTFPAYTATDVAVREMRSFQARAEKRGPDESAAREDRSRAGDVTRRSGGQPGPVLDQNTTQENVMSDRLKALREKRGVAVKEMRDIIEAAEAEKRDMSAEELEKHGKAFAKVEGLRSQIEAEERTIEAERRQAETEARTTDARRAEERGKPKSADES
jgi:hypothetical protein